MALWKNLTNRLKDAGKKASTATDKLSKFVQKPGNPIPWVLNPNYKQINKPTMSAAKPAPKKKKGLLASISEGIRSVGRSIDKTVTQPIAKEVKHIVQPVAGEVAMRAKDLANSKAVKQAGDAIGDGLRSFDKNVIQPVSTSKTMKTIQGKAQQAADYVGDEVRNIPGSLKDMAQASQDPEKKGSFLPFFTKIIPDAAGDVVGGLGRTAAGLLTADGDKIGSGLKRVGSGVWDATKHSGLGTLEVAGRMFGQGPSGSYTQGGGKGSTVEQLEQQEKGKGPIAETPEQKETIETLKTFSSDAWGSFKDLMKTVYDEGIKPGFDSMNVKVKRTRYADVAIPAEIEAYRRADASGDKRTKDMIEAQWQYRKKFPGRDYTEDFMGGKAYQP